MNRLFTLIVALTLCGSCQSDSGYNETTNEDTSKVQSDKEVIQNKTLDSLNKVYAKKGFEDFCIIKADLDSVFLTAQYMAEILTDGDVTSEAFKKLSHRIEKARAIAYFKKNNLNRDKVNQDMMYLAMEYPNPCEDYVNSKYRMVKEYLRTKHRKQLYQEAFMNYK